MSAEGWEIMPHILELVKELEARIVGADIQDNQRCQQLFLQIFPDGSGQVMRDYSSARKDETESERLLRSVFHETDCLFGFNSIAELHGELVALTMRVKRGTNDSDD